MVSLTIYFFQIQLKHPHPNTFHKSQISSSDDERYTRFYRWHIDAALYDLAPPRVTSLYAVCVPRGRKQILRYEDGSNDEIQVPLGTTACKQVLKDIRNFLTSIVVVSGKTMFERLSPEEKSLAIRSTIVYASHPYVWMSNARSRSTGLGLESDGLELYDSELPHWEECKVKRYPMVSSRTLFCLMLTCKIRFGNAR